MNRTNENESVMIDSRSEAIARFVVFNAKYNRKVFGKIDDAKGFVRVP